MKYYEHEDRYRMFDNTSWLEKGQDVLIATGHGEEKTKDGVWHDSCAVSIGREWDTGAYYLRFQSPKGDEVFKVENPGDLRGKFESVISRDPRWMENRNYTVIVKDTLSYMAYELEERTHFDSIEKAEAQTAKTVKALKRELLGQYGEDGMDFGILRDEDDWFVFSNEERHVEVSLTWVAID